MGFISVERSRGREKERTRKGKKEEESSRDDWSSVRVKQNEIVETYQSLMS
jgi:hypothetical protein